MLPEKGEGVWESVAAPVEDTGLTGRRGDVGEPSTRRTEREQEVTGDFSAGETSLCGP